MPSKGLRNMDQHDVASRLHYICDNLGYSKKDLINLTGLPRQTINNLWWGTRVPKIDTCLIIANALGMHVDDIWTMDMIIRHQKPRYRRTKDELNW